MGRFLMGSDLGLAPVLVRGLKRLTQVQRRNMPRRSVLQVVQLLEGLRVQQMAEISGKELDRELSLKRLLWQ